MKKALLFILFSMFWLNTTFSQPIIKIWGCEDSLAVKQQITLYLEQLNIWENIYLSVGFSPNVPNKRKGFTICLNSQKDNGYQIVKVSIDDRLNKTEKRIVLAHEMVHVKQYAKGELQVNSKREVMWQGRKYGNQFTDFQRTPWENEAYQQDNQLATLYKKQLENPFDLNKPLTASKTIP